MNLVQYNEYLVSTVDTDGLGIRGHSAEQYAPMGFQTFVS